MDDVLPIRRALLSVSDKSGLVELARGLVAHGAELLSTGGTARVLQAAGLPVREVSDHTGFPEILDGRVKTLVPQIHGGILARRDDAAHMAQANANGLALIDLVVVNLYPFETTVLSGANEQDCLETIDIGGPALIRAAAKNYQFVSVLTDPADYAMFRAELEDQGGVTTALRRRLASQAYACTAAYDAAIAGWFAARHDEPFPRRLTLSATKRQSLRYGENPHQQAAFYADGSAGPGLATARQIQGKELSYNNLADSDAALLCASEFAAPAIVIVKHANPCGVAVGANLLQAWGAALACDPVSAFGGIVALNRTLDEATAERIAELFTEVVVAPEATDAAASLLARKRNVRLLLTGGLPDPGSVGLLVRSVVGGFLVQSRDAARAASSTISVVTRRAPTDAELSDLIFAEAVAKHVKSNAIVLAQAGATVGIGAGQMSRLDSARLAVAKAGGRAAGSVAASDAFFPFADGLDELVRGGVTAVIQPGGSVRDAEVISAADSAGVAMVFSGLRHFHH